MDQLVYVLNLPVTIGHLFAIACGWLAFKLVRAALSFIRILWVEYPCL